MIQPQGSRLRWLVGSVRFVAETSTIGARSLLYPTSSYVRLTLAGGVVLVLVCLLVQTGGNVTASLIRNHRDFETFQQAGAGAGIDRTRSFEAKRLANSRFGETIKSTVLRGLGAVLFTTAFWLGITQFIRPNHGFASAAIGGSLLGGWYVMSWQLSRSLPNHPWLEAATVLGVLSAVGWLIQKAGIDAASIFKAVALSTVVPTVEHAIRIAIIVANGKDLGPFTLRGVFRGNAAWQHWMSHLDLTVIVWCAVAAAAFAVAWRRPYWLSLTIVTALTFANLLVG